MLALPAFLRRRYRTQVPTATGTAYHTLTIPECLDQLTTDSQEGLTSSEVQARLVQHGPNQLRGQGGVSALRVCFRQVANAMTLVLIAALVISFVVKDWIEGGVIAFIVALNVTIGFFQEYRAEKTMDSLRKMASPTSRVLRSGHLVTIATIDLVPGDILVFEVGDVVGADCRMCEVFNLEIDEALLTGESLPVAKITTPIEDPHQPLGDRINLAFASTMVTKGRGR
ncbi:E1-E2 ATPase-domain-containing protein, partial [Dimargaris cristalligena]